MTDADNGRKPIEAKCDLTWCKARLKEIGKVQTDLAAHLGISDGAANQFFWGNRYIKIDEVETFANFFEMNPSDFLRRCGLNLVGNQGAIDQVTLSGVIENAYDIFEKSGVDLTARQKAQIIARVYQYIKDEDLQGFDAEVAIKQIKNLLLFVTGDAE